MSSETKKENIENSGLPIIVRRRLSISGASLVISIPKEWLDEKGLTQGDKVILVANGDLTIHKDDPSVVKELSAKLRQEIT